ncbi:MAG: hypothetical protein GW942_00405 [Candidatus Pacebacteria bacterium]|nr:hypothetical protein [Candidatus Paceibacterota bacterium]
MMAKLCDTIIDNTYLNNLIMPRRNKEFDSLYGRDDEYYEQIEKSNLSDYELSRIPEEERAKYLNALEITNPIRDQEVFDLQAEFSYWFIDELCVLSDSLFYTLQRKCEEWQRDSQNRLLGQAVREIYDLLNKLGLIDFQFTNNPSEMYKEVTRNYNTHGIGGSVYQAMETANGVLGQHRSLKRSKELLNSSPSFRQIVGVLFFSGQMKENSDRKRKEAINSVSHLVKRYKLFHREIKNADGMKLKDGSTLSLKSAIERFSEFTPPFDI